MLLSTSDYGKLVGLSSNTIRQYIRGGMLKGTKIANRWLVDDNEKIQYKYISLNNKRNYIDKE